MITARREDRLRAVAERLTRLHGVHVHVIPCDLATDAFRAALLELHGYRADVIEFVAAEHTARNVMIRAERRPRPDARAHARARAAYDELRPLWRDEGAAERLLGAP